MVINYYLVMNRSSTAALDIKLSSTSGERNKLEGMSKASEDVNAVDLLGLRTPYLTFTLQALLMWVVTASVVR